MVHVGCSQAHVAPSSMRHFNEGFQSSMIPPPDNQTRFFTMYRHTATVSSHARVSCMCHATQIQPFIKQVNINVISRPTAALMYPEVLRQASSDKLNERLERWRLPSINVKL